MAYIKVEDEKHLVRESYSKAILNVDTSAIQKHNKRLRQINNEKRIQEEINTMKQDIADIKQMLRSLTKQGE